MLRVPVFPFSLEYSSQERLHAMMIEVIMGGPKLVFIWGEYGTVSKSENVAGEIVLVLNPFGNEHLVFHADTHQTLVKGPVAKAAEGKAVRRLVIRAFPPGLDVGSFFRSLGDTPTIVAVRSYISMDFPHSHI